MIFAKHDQDRENDDNIPNYKCDQSFHMGGVKTDSKSRVPRSLRKRIGTILGRNGTEGGGLQAMKLKPTICQPKTVNFNLYKKVESDVMSWCLRIPWEFPLQQEDSINKLDQLRRLRL